MMLFTDGNQVNVWLNGVLVSDANTFPLMEKRASEGFLNNFAFQLHKRQAVTVRFKDVEIMSPTIQKDDGRTRNGWLGSGYLNQ